VRGHYSQEVTRTDFSFGFWALAFFIAGCHLWSTQRLVLVNGMGPYAGYGELAGFPNFGSVQQLLHVQLLGPISLHIVC
jgi:hypothetical protein